MLPDLIGSIDDFRFIGRLQWLQVDSNLAFIADFIRYKYVGDEIKWWNLVPGRLEILLNFDRLKSIFFQANRPGAIISEGNRNGGIPNFYVVNVDQSPKGVTADRHSPLHTAGRSQHQEDQQGKKRLCHLKQNDSQGVIQQGLKNGREV